MHFSLAALAVFASSTSASLVARQLPTCTYDCLYSPNVDLGGCSPTDNLCLCKSVTFVTKSTACIVQSCKGDDLRTAISAAKSMCAAVGITSIVASATSFNESKYAPTAPTATQTSSGSGSNTAGVLMCMAAFGLITLAL